MVARIGELLAPPWSFVIVSVCLFVYQQDYAKLLDRTVVTEDCLLCPLLGATSGQSGFPKGELSFSILAAIFPGELELASFIGAKDNGNGGDNWSCKTCKAPVMSSPLTNQHPTFYRPDALTVTQPTAS